MTIMKKANRRVISRLYHSPNCVRSPGQTQHLLPINNASELRRRTSICTPPSLREIQKPISNDAAFSPSKIQYKEAELSPGFADPPHLADLCDCTIEFMKEGKWYSWDGHTVLLAQKSHFFAVYIKTLQWRKKNFNSKHTFKFTDIDLPIIVSSNLSTCLKTLYFEPAEVIGVDHISLTKLHDLIYTASFLGMNDFLSFLILTAIPRIELGTTDHVHALDIMSLVEVIICNTPVLRDSVRQVCTKFLRFYIPFLVEIMFSNIKGKKVTLERISDLIDHLLPIIIVEQSPISTSLSNGLRKKNHRRTQTAEKLPLFNLPLKENGQNLSSSGCMTDRPQFMYRRNSEGMGYNSYSVHHIQADIDDENDNESITSSSDEFSELGEFFERNLVGSTNGSNPTSHRSHIHSQSSRRSSARDNNNSSSNSIPLPIMRHTRRPTTVDDDIIGEIGLNNLGDLSFGHSDEAIEEHIRNLSDELEFSSSSSDSLHEVLDTYSTSTMAHSTSIPLNPSSDNHLSADIIRHNAYHLSQTDASIPILDLSSVRNSQNYVRSYRPHSKRKIIRASSNRLAVLRPRRRTEFAPATDRERFHIEMNNSSIWNRFDNQHHLLTKSHYGIPTDVVHTILKRLLSLPPLMWYVFLSDTDSGFSDEFNLAWFLAKAAGGRRNQKISLWQCVFSRIRVDILTLDELSKLKRIHKFFADPYEKLQNFLPRNRKSLAKMTQLSLKATEIPTEFDVVDSLPDPALIPPLPGFNDMEPTNGRRRSNGVQNHQVRNLVATSSISSEEEGENPWLEGEKLVRPPGLPLPQNPLRQFTTIRTFQWILRDWTEINVHFVTSPLFKDAYGRSWKAYFYPGADTPEQMISFYVYVGETSAAYRANSSRWKRNARFRAIFSTGKDGDIYVKDSAPHIWDCASNNWGYHNVISRKEFSELVGNKSRDLSLILTVAVDDAIFEKEPPN